MFSLGVRLVWGAIVSPLICASTLEQRQFNRVVRAPILLDVAEQSTPFSEDRGSIRLGQGIYTLKCESKARRSCSSEIYVVPRRKSIEELSGFYHLG